MPEGPEIRRAADKIARAVEGKRAEWVFFAFPELKRYERRLRAKKVRGVETRGKAILVHFAGGLSVYSHNQLYGRWYVRRPDSLPRTRRQLRFAIHVADRSALLYSASDIEVLDAEGIAEHPFLSRLGPDVLDSRLRPSAVTRRLLQERFRRRRLGGLLLDQGFLGGLGNYLRSEILFVAGVAPGATPQSLDDEDARRLGKATLDMVRRSYRTGGITNEPSRVKELRARGEPRSRYRFFVFGRDGEPCWTCGEEIRREESAGRRIYFCPRCQGITGT